MVKIVRGIPKKRSALEQAKDALSAWWGKLWGPNPYIITAKSSPSPYPSPSPTPDLLAEQVQSGFGRYAEKYGIPVPPIATASAYLAQLGRNLPHPFLPAALTLKESTGLAPVSASHPDYWARERMRQYTNPVGIMDASGLVRYPSLETAILGGGPQNQRGLQGVLLGRRNEPSRYQDYLSSGNLEDFFRVYTPPGGSNASLETQLKTINELLSYFQ